MAYQQLPLGTSDFKSLISQSKYYIDKTQLIDDVIHGSDVTLLPRPRRFGKTLNMSMLHYFFTNHQHNRHLFNGLAIENNAAAMAHCGQYPVIYLSFKDVKEACFDDVVRNISALVKDLYVQHQAVWEDSQLTDEDGAFIDRIRQGTCDTVLLAASVKKLSQLLAAHYHQPVVILIDEYDMPINSAYTYGYYDELVGFLRNMLSGAFKDNPSLFKGVMTGILRIARESIFSGLNNIEVCSLTEREFNHHFGFTSAETEQALADYGLTHTIDSVRTWYNGYNFGGVTIYNPWSILHFIKKHGELKPYWLNTSDNALVRDLIARASPQVKQELEALLVDKEATVRKALNENIVFQDIHYSDDAIWNFLLFSGYLSYQNKALEDKRIYADLCIPNLEVAAFYEEAVLTWFEQKANATQRLPVILEALLTRQFDYFCEAFELFAEESFSYFDVTGKAAESFYHAFVLGMLVQLQPTHSINSNRESGFGRYDVCLIPLDKSQPAFVFEFKKVSKRQQETLESACDAALTQIDKKQYVAELHALGIKSVYPIAIAFEGKRALVKVG
tara:strand:+ start:729 stop:2408 length:1680 start_codon:yes stop_codon:yes gene_type:complete